MQHHPGEVEEETIPSSLEGDQPHTGTIPGCHLGRNQDSIFLTPPPSESNNNQITRGGGGGGGGGGQISCRSIVAPLVAIFCHPS